MPRAVTTSAAEYFEDHPLLELVELRNGSMSNSFQSRSNDYELKCKNCGTIFNRTGDSSALKAVASCPSCRYKYNNAEKVITTPSGATAKTLEELQEEEDATAPTTTTTTPKTKVKKTKPKAVPLVEDETTTTVGDDFDPFAILAKAQERVTKERLADVPKVILEYGDENIDEEPAPTKSRTKAQTKAPAKTPEKAPVEPCTPQITTETVQVLRVKVGQNVMIEGKNGPIWIIAEP